VDGATIKQQLLGQRGLASVGVRDDGKGPPTGDFFLKSHGQGSFLVEKRQKNTLHLAAAGASLRMPPGRQRDYPTTSLTAWLRVAHMARRSSREAARGLLQPSMVVQ
jgi:hypothetical protein